MPSPDDFIQRKRLVVLFLLSIAILIVSVAIPLSLANARAAGKFTGCCRPSPPAILTTVPAGRIPRLCGQLVYLVDTKDPSYRSSGLLPCSGGKPYIFDVHPRDTIPYFQFRDVTVESGKKLCDIKYGCLNQHITWFQNYIGIENCQACGVRNLPTWTTAPLTPYTPTPVPPTATLYVPSATTTETPTPTRGEVTETPNIFEILRGTSSPTLQPTVVSSSTPPGTAVPIPSRGFPAICGFGLAPMLLLAYLGWAALRHTGHY